MLIGSSDGYLYALKANGENLGEGWPVKMIGTEDGVQNDVDSSPAVADLNRDGTPEIIVGSDEGWIHALDVQGNYLPGWPVFTGGEVFSSAAIGDLDSDGLADILIGSDVGATGDLGNQSCALFGLKADGTSLPGFPIEYPIGTYGETRLRSSPLIADLDNNGLMDFTIAIYTI